MSGTDEGYEATRHNYRYCRHGKGRGRRRISRQSARQRPISSGCNENWRRPRWDAASVFGGSAAVYLSLIHI
eukprot:215073-Rhodomonas_salina.1